ncbi:hypothetical protein SAMN05421690_100522 [Nitrosomonas sp. Nm51]|nr:hypothetical protein SAMN05421690_100522 [Nitrosomonas sp. Nm51]
MVPRRQEERRRQHQKWQPFSGMGVCRVDQFCDTLLRTGKEVLSAKESQTQLYCCHQIGEHKLTRSLSHIKHKRCFLLHALLHAVCCRTSRSSSSVITIKLPFKCRSVPQNLISSSVDKIGSNHETLFPPAAAGWMITGFQP